MWWYSVTGPASPHQLGLRTITVRWSASRERIMKGPVPLAVRTTGSSSRAAKFCGTAPRLASLQPRSITRMRVILSGITASGARVTMSTVSASTASARSTVSTKMP